MSDTSAIQSALTMSTTPKDHPDISRIYEVFAIEIYKFTNDVSFPSPNTWWTDALEEAQKLFHSSGDECDLVRLIISCCSTKVRNKLTLDQNCTLEVLGEKMVYFDRCWINNMSKELNNEMLFKGEDLAVDKRWANCAFNRLGSSTVVTYQIMKSLVKIYYYDFIDANVQLPGILNSNHLDFEKQLNHFFEELEWICKQRAQLKMIIPLLTSCRDLVDPSVADLACQIAELTTAIDAAMETTDRQAKQIKSLEAKVNSLEKIIQQDQCKDWRRAGNDASMSHVVETGLQTPHQGMLTAAVINCSPVSAVADSSAELSMMSLETAQHLDLKISQKNPVILQLLLGENTINTYGSVRGQLRCNEYPHLQTLPFAVVDENLSMDVVLGHCHLDIFNSTIS